MIPDNIIEWVSLVLGILLSGIGIMGIVQTLDKESRLNKVKILYLFMGIILIVTALYP